MSAKTPTQKVIGSIWQELLFGSHLISLGSSGIILSIVLIFGLPFSPWPLIIAYLVFQIIYTYNHARELAIDAVSNPERAAHLSKGGLWQRFAPYLYTVLLGTVLGLFDYQTALLSIFIVVGGILYTIQLKRTPLLGFKTYYVSFFWAISVLLIPAFYKVSFAPYAFLVLFIFIRGIVNTIFSDLKDIESDRSEHIKTFPVRWGKDMTLRILQVINLLSAIPILVGVYASEVPAISCILLLTILNGVYYLISAGKIDDKKIRLLSAVLIDGEYILWWIPVLLAKLLFA